MSDSEDEQYIYSDEEDGDGDAFMAESPSAKKARDETHPATRGQFLPTLALVTTVDVVVGRELTFDYAGGAPDDAVEDSRTECFCGARNCRGWLLRHVE